jgi:hypothetical protein
VDHETGMVGYFLAATPPALQGSVAVPIVAILIVALIGIGAIVWNTRKLLGGLMVGAGIILLLGTTLGTHIKAGVNGLING